MKSQTAIHLNTKYNRMRSVDHDLQKYGHFKIVSLTSLDEALDNMK